MSSGEIEALNQILSMIDEKATHFKDVAYDLSTVQRNAQKKLLFDLIDDAVRLCKTISPEPREVLNDLGTLSNQLNRYG